MKKILIVLDGEEAWPRLVPVAFLARRWHHRVIVVELINGHIPDHSLLERTGVLVDERITTWADKPVPKRLRGLAREADVVLNTLALEAIEGLPSHYPDWLRLRTLGNMDPSKNAQWPFQVAMGTKVLVVNSLAERVTPAALREAHNFLVKGANWQIIWCTDTEVPPGMQEGADERIWFIPGPGVLEELALVEKADWLLTDRINLAAVAPHVRTPVIILDQEWKALENINRPYPPTDPAPVQGLPFAEAVLRKEGLWRE